MVDRGYLHWQLRRGKLELDVVLQRFVEHHPLATLVDDEVTALEQLLTRSDDELLDLFLSRQTAPELNQRRLVEKILAAADHSPG